ncbi:lipase family protein, partial [Paucibacter soli]|uniref:lipase family protein n=1 Tax=Paucibacter soli TaxID=3133433 RepID=UPI003095420C
MADSAINQSSNYDLNRALDAAQLADAAYLVDRGFGVDRLADRLAELGWTPLTASAPGFALDAAGGFTTGNGFEGGADAGLGKSGYAFVATREVDGKKEYAISFAGTNFSDPGDKQSDFVINGFSNAYVALRPLFAELLKQAVAEKNSGVDVSILITGHSLGGAIAQAALADLSTNPDIDLWKLSGTLGHGDRIYDLGSLNGIQSDVAALMPATQMITFGAPSLLTDPFKLTQTEFDLNPLTFPALLETLAPRIALIFNVDVSNIDTSDGNFFAKHAIQFEHGRVFGTSETDPVATLGGVDLGQVVKIDISDVDSETGGGLLSRYEIFGPKPALLGMPMHGVGNYTETILRALSQSPLVSTENVAQPDSPVLPGPQVAEPANEAIEASSTLTAASGFGGNDILYVTSANPGGVIGLNGGSGVDAYVIKASNVTATISGPSGERLDHLYFYDRFGAVAIDPLTENNDDLVIKFTDSLNITSTVTVKNWFASAGTGYQLASIEQIQPFVGSNWKAVSYDYSSLGIPLINEGTSGDDLITGSSLGDVMHSGAGADAMNGRGGIDTLYGGTDGDILDGGTGIDALYGESGNDTLKTFDTGDTLDGGADNDTYIIQAPSEMGAPNTVTIHDESGTDAIQVQAINADYEKTTFRRDANNLIIEIRSSGAGNPVLEVVTVQDMATPSSRVETLGITNEGSSKLYNFDLTAAWNGATGTAAYVAAAYKGSATGGYYNGDGNDVFNGTIADEEYHGGGGGDTITGGGGSDRLYGDTGQDTFNVGGLIGTTIVDGGAGRDTLWVDGSATGA